MQCYKHLFQYSDVLMLILKETEHLYKVLHVLYYLKKLLFMPLPPQTKTYVTLPFSTSYYIVLFFHSANSSVSYYLFSIAMCISNKINQTPLCRKQCDPPF